MKKTYLILMILLMVALDLSAQNGALSREKVILSGTVRQQKTL